MQLDETFICLVHSARTVEKTSFIACKVTILFRIISIFVAEILKNKQLTNQATLDFIQQHRTDDVRRLALQGAKHPEVDLHYALEQIAGWQKARTKLPSWSACESLVYPPHLSMEQCSSEATATYKAQIAGQGRLFVDLTAGFGVDAAFIAQGFQQAVIIEQQENLCAIVAENYKRLGLSQVEVFCGDGAPMWAALCSWCALIYGFYGPDAQPDWKKELKEPTIVTVAERSLAADHSNGPAFLGHIDS